MKIYSLEIEGYRSLKDITWEPGDLNILIGPNGSGKSNLLRMLELISISARGGLGDHVQRAGGMDPLVWDGKSKQINFCIKTRLHAKDNVFERGLFSYRLILDRLGKGTGYQIYQELFDSLNPVANTNLTMLLARERRNGYVYSEAKNGLSDLPKEILSEEETFLSQHTPPPPFAYNSFFSPFRIYLTNWSIYHDLHTNKDAPIRQPIITRHEKRVDPDGQNLISVLHTLYTEDRNFKNDINLAMRAAFGDDFEELVFPPAADQRIQMRIRWKSLSREQSAADLSDGTLRFLFLMAVLATPDPAPLIAIDEPETGLHPSMFPIIAEYAAEASERTQIILTTHSPQFLDAFKDIVPKTTVVKSIEGQTVLEEVDSAQLERWMKEYTLGALFRSGELENGFGEDDVAPDAGEAE